MEIEGKTTEKDIKKAVTFECNCLIFKWCHQYWGLILNRVVIKLLVVFWDCSLASFTPANFNGFQHLASYVQCSRQNGCKPSALS